MIAAVPGPTPLWYATRGSGYAALLLLTGTTVLGLLTSMRWHSPRWPRFLSQTLHRNLSLMVVVFVVIHVATSIIDPFAGLGVKDSVVPFAASYRPLWLGLGVVSLELLLAIVITSLVRHLLSWRAWQAVHLLAYVSWPVAVLHTIGTGTDTKSAWALLLDVACVGAVAATLVWRLGVGWPRQAVLRSAGIAVSLASVIALTAWTASGPLQAGWARAAGTPANLLTSGQSPPSTAGAPPTAAPASVLQVGLNDPVSGSLQQSGAQTTATLTDQANPALMFVIVVGADGSAHLLVNRSGATVCSSPATVGQTVTAVCGSVEVLLQLVQNTPGVLTGTLFTTATGR